jgi:Ca2+-binding EF-hand superfamily protein
VPPNILDGIESRLAKVGRFLKRAFGNDKALERALRDSCLVQDKNNNISVDKLKNFVLDSCKDQIIHRKISKKDVEAFLSAFNYNTYGATNIDSVSKLVFTNENYVAQKLSRKTRPNPPPDEVNAELLHSLDYDEEVTSINIGATEIEPPPPKVHTKSIFSAPVDFQKASVVLREIEDKVYCGGLPRHGTFQTVFRQIFDVDGDGFVSHADFEGACRKLQVKADYNSILHAIRALDSERKGYLDFRTFSKRLTPGIGDRVAKMDTERESGGALSELHFPDVGPSKSRLTTVMKKTGNIQQTVRDVRQSFNPDYDTSKPSSLALLNTFVRARRIDAIRGQSPPGGHLPELPAALQLGGLPAGELAGGFSHGKSLPRLECGLLAGGPRKEAEPAAGALGDQAGEREQPEPEGLRGRGAEGDTVPVKARPEGRPQQALRAPLPHAVPLRERRTRCCQLGHIFSQKQQI